MNLTDKINVHLAESGPKAPTPAEIEASYKSIFRNHDEPECTLEQYRRMVRTEGYSAADLLDEEMICSAIDDYFVDFSPGSNGKTGNDGGDGLAGLEMVISEALEQHQDAVESISSQVFRATSPIYTTAKAALGDDLTPEEDQQMRNQLIQRVLDAVKAQCEA